MGIPTIISNYPHLTNVWTVVHIETTTGKAISLRAPEETTLSRVVAYSPHLLPRRTPFFNSP